MPIRIKDVVKVEKKKIDRSQMVEGYNQALTDIGKKKIGLDREKIEKLIDRYSFDYLMAGNYAVNKHDLANALIQAEGEIIREVG